MGIETGIDSSTDKSYLMGFPSNKINDSSKLGSPYYGLVDASLF